MHTRCRTKSPAPPNDWRTSMNNAKNSCEKNHGYDFGNDHRPTPHCYAERNAKRSMFLLCTLLPNPHHRPHLQRRAVRRLRDAGVARPGAELRRVGDKSLLARLVGWGVGGG